MRIDRRLSSGFKTYLADTSLYSAVGFRTTKSSTTMLIMTPYQRLQGRRKETGKTQVEVADYMSVAESTYRSWEKDTFPRTYKQMVRLCRFLGMTVDYYLSGDDAVLLDKGEALLIEWFRSMPLDAKNAMGVLVRHNMVERKRA